MLLYRNPKHICTRLGLAFFAMMLVWLGVSTMLQGPLLAFWPGALGNAWVIWLLNDIPLYGVALPVFLAIMRSVPDGPEYARPTVTITAGRYVLILLGCFGATYLFSYVSVFLTTLFQAFFGGGAGFYTDALDEMIGGGGLLPNLLFGACVPALGEEYLFRHYLRRKLRGCADSTYILMSGLCFSVFHANLSQMLYAFVLGALFAWLYLVTDNIWLPVSLHFVINLFGIIIMPAAAEGQATAALASAFVLGTIPLAVVLFFVYRKRMAATLLPPTEPGWPYNAPRPAHQPAAPAYAAAAYAQPTYAQPSYTPPAYAQPVYTQQQPYATAANAPSQQPYAQQPHVQPASAWQQQPYAQPQPYAQQPAPVEHRTYAKYQPPASPAYTQPPYGQPYAPPYQHRAAKPPKARRHGATYAPYAQPAAAYAAYGWAPPRKQRVLGFCLGNAGMVLYLVLAGLLTLMTLMVTALF